MIQTMARWFVVLLLLAAAPVSPAQTSTAGQHAYPSKPIRLIAPFAPGGPTDLLARLMAQKLTERLGQSVMVDNRPGAGGTIGADITAKAPGDGHTIVLVSNSFAVNASLYRNLPYDTLRDFAPVSLLASAPFVLAVHPAVPARSVQELIALAKGQPGRLNYGSGGSGSGPHVVAELFKSSAGVDIVHIPYKGTGPVIAGLMAGQVQLTFGNLLALLPHIKSGQLRAVATTGAKRPQALPDVPTVTESGLAGFEANGSHGILAPASTPRPVVERLNEEIVKVLRTPEMRAQLAAEGAEVIGSTPEEFAAYLREEVGKWARVVKDSGMRVE